MHIKHVNPENKKIFHLMAAAEGSLDWYSDQQKSFNSLWKRNLLLCISSQYGRSWMPTEPTKGKVQECWMRKVLTVCIWRWYRKVLNMELSELWKVKESRTWKILTKPFFQRRIPYGRSESILKRIPYHIFKNNRQLSSIKSSKKWGDENNEDEDFKWLLCSQITMYVFIKNVFYT